MKAKDIRKLLKKVGLPSGGKKVVLVKRHREFMLRHNAELDSGSPKSDKQIALEMKKEIQQLVKDKKKKKRSMVNLERKKIELWDRLKVEAMRKRKRKRKRKRS